MGKRIRVKSKDRSGMLSVFNSKGYIRKKRGQPTLNPDIKVGIIARIKMYKRLTPYKAWLQITKLKNFPYILEMHFKNRKGSADWWIKRFENLKAKPVLEKISTEITYDLFSQRIKNNNPLPSRLI